MIVGKVEKSIVTRSAAISRSASPGSKCVIVTIRAPASSTATSGSTKLMWNIGRGSKNRSSAVRRKRSLPAWSEVRTSASCESGQPLGSAVVPDVYIMIATSRRRIRRRSRSTSSAGTRSPSDSKAARPRKPGRSPDPIVTTERRAAALPGASATGSAARASAGKAASTTPSWSACSATRSLVTRATSSASAAT